MIQSYPLVKAIAHVMPDRRGDTFSPSRGYSRIENLAEEARVEVHRMDKREVIFEPLFSTEERANS